MKRSVILVIVATFYFLSINTTAQNRIGNEFPAEIRIEAINVLGIVEKINIVDGIMQPPTGLHLAGWYEESSQLGVPGNVLITGYYFWDGLPSLFSELALLRPGDLIELASATGKSYKYQVLWVQTYSKENAPMQEIVGASDGEALTLITDAGTAVTMTGSFSSSTVVRAMRASS